MVRLRSISVIILCSLFFGPLRAQVWRSHLAYNNVTQIAMAPDKVYALSDGSLFSVDKQTEKIRIYDRQSGLHGSNITCIGYDTRSDQLVIGYADGRIDLLTSSGTRYISALYEKDMTQRKTIYNVTFSGHTAYLATHYGIQTMDMNQHKLVNSYWLRPGGEETPVQDVSLTGDSIYAFTEDSLFCAALSDNIVDYTYWKREKRSTRIQPDPEKGKHYQDATDQWYAGGPEGILRLSVTGRLSYKPQSPLSNIPYRMHYAQGRLYVVQGGRWAAEMKRQGMVMIYDGEQWINIPGDSITPKTGINVFDFMNVAVKPDEPKHYFVTSYGTGLYEFDNDCLIRHYLPAEDNTLESAVKGAETRYTRLDYATYDKQGNLWLLDAGEVTYTLVCLDAQGVWHGLPVKEDVPFHTPGGLIIDNHRTNYKWIATARINTALFLLDDGGTLFDASDDRIIGRSEWLLPDGHSFSPSFIYDLMQSADGRIWIATEQGVLIIDTQTDYFLSNRAAHPQIVDGNGENPMADLAISALCQDKDGNIWVGTNTLGVYVLNAAATEITAHYTTDNSAMPSNAVLSLCTDENGNMFIGTGNGLVEFRPHDDPAGSSRTVDEVGRDLGSILQWKLHLSYTDMEQVLATPDRIYARANGSLFYIDRADDHIGYMDKTTGLNGSTVTQIGYDPGSSQLVIGYADGRIDLVDRNDNVNQMPDLHMKASSVAVTINAISVGKNRTYLAMPFGIIGINTKKGEVSDTYYIGSEASDVNVLQVMEIGDSIFAVSDDSLYAASLQNNLVDFSFWKTSRLPAGKIRQAAVFDNEVHLLVDSILYRRHNGQWQKKQTKLNWIHAADGQMLTYIEGQGLFRILDDYTLAGLTANYAANDAVYTNGEYWLAAENKGLVRLNNSGDAVFTPDGPNSNNGYFLHTAHGRIYATVGGRWASQFVRLPKISIYTGQEWNRFIHWDLYSVEGDTWVFPYDPVSIAVDPNDADHFYIASYCAGVFEYNHGAITRYGDGVNGSSIKAFNADSSLDKRFYTRTDGAMMDEQGNLWVLNATEIGQPVHVMTHDHKWHPLPLRSSGKGLVLNTPAGIWTDRRDSNRKWFIDQRVTQGVILLDDGGTPANSTDDRCLKRSSFVDQNGRQLSPSYFYCMAQDRNDRMWIGTEAGILIIPESTDFFTSNECQRIIIPRNDGTGLGDYLLANEQINCMAVDGGNRMWIGTAGSGLYLIEDDTITVAHFTDNNSMLPSNTILSIAIIPGTGEVFVGTDRGIASYLSDASEPNEDMSGAYAYPNPVRPDYGGAVSITGLMDNSEVNIIDSGGNLVCKTRSNGGTAVWDLRLADGQHAKSGIYTALCNTNGGHAAVKIMVIQ